MDKTKSIKLALVVMLSILHMVRCTGHSGQDTVDGALGDGRVFFADSVDYTGYVNDAVDSNSCCEKCRTYDTDTNLIEFYEQGKDCWCSKRKPGKQPRTGVLLGYFSDVCESVDGTLGDGRVFFGASVVYGGRVNSVVDSTRCCEECQAQYGGGFNLIEFYEQGKDCWCSKRMPGKRPRTGVLSGYFSDVCERTN